MAVHKLLPLIRSALLQLNENLEWARRNIPQVESKHTNVVQTKITLQITNQKCTRKPSDMALLLLELVESFVIAVLNALNN